MITQIHPSKVDNENRYAVMSPIKVSPRIIPANIAISAHVNAVNIKSQ